MSTRVLDTELSLPRLSEGFVRSWLDALALSCRYEVEFPFAFVPSLSGKKVAVCAPLLSYTHLGSEEASRFCLNSTFRYPRAKFLEKRKVMPVEGEAVLSMVPLSRWTDIDEYWKTGVSKKLRNQIRKCEKEGLYIDWGDDDAYLDAFYQVFLLTMHRHGTPAFSLETFRSIRDRLDTNVILVKKTGVTLAGFFIVFDENIALMQWAGSYSKSGYANLFGEWAAVRLAFERGCSWFDLGRSAYLSAGFQHKQKWRPECFAASLFPEPETSVYDKYQFAASVWKRLPASITNWLGPMIARRLPDF